jgi:hypothetical protein
MAPTGISGKRVTLKPNFNSADACPASTHDDTLKQLVTELKERDARSVTLGESSGPRGTVSVLDAKGTRDLARDVGFDVVNFDEIADSDWVPFSPPGTHWPEGYHLPRLVTDAEYMVSTCCLKTHGSGGVFTMSMKLAVGLTPRPIRRPMHASPDMRRMIAELNQGYRPDLIVMDGGRGQVNIALEVLAELNLEIPVMGLVKDDFHRTRGIIFQNAEYGFEGMKEARNLLTRIQDEVHRFAITYHRTLRDKRTLHSILEDIPKVGERRRRSLMVKFGSIEAIRAASIKELAETPSIDQSTAESIHRYFHGEKKEKGSSGEEK